MRLLVSSEQKLVAFLQGQLGNYSGKFIRRLLEANLCRINGRIERFGSKVVKGGDSIELAPSWQSLLIRKMGRIATIYEDELLKVINKPAGFICEDREVVKAFGPNHYLVHRLDKDTTGLLILAKNIQMRDELMALFEGREVHKEYLALVDGVPKENEGTRKSLLAKKGAYEGQTIWGSSPRGLTAITHWKKLAVGKNASLVLCTPETGRTHQIRVHMAEMGHPILVDRQYAKQFRCQQFIQRPLLHAFRLQFKGLDLRAPLFLDIREGLRGCNMDVRHLGQFFGDPEHDGSRNNCNDDKDAKEIEERAHFLHQSGE